MLSSREAAPTPHRIINLNLGPDARKSSPAGKMNRRHILMVVVGLALVYGVVFLLRPKESNRPLVHFAQQSPTIAKQVTSNPFRLRIVRREMQNGNPVIFFKVEARVAEDLRFGVCFFATKMER
jgi:hypothetical protein